MSTPEQGSPVAPPTGSTNGETPEAATGQAAETNQYITRDAFEALAKRLDSQSGILAKLSRALEKADKPAASNGDRQPDPLSEKTKRLSDLETRLNEKDARLRQRTVRTAIKSTLSDSNVNPQYVEDLTDLLVARHGKQFVVDEGLDTDVVQFRHDEITEPVHLKSWVSNFLQTDKGRAYLQTKRNPQIAGGASGSIGQTHPYSKLTYTEIMEKSRTDYAAFAEYVHTYPEEFRAKKGK